MKNLKKFGLIPFVLLVGLFFAAPQEAKAQVCTIKNMKVGFLGICSGEGTSCTKYKGNCKPYIN